MNRVLIIFIAGASFASSSDAASTHEKWISDTFAEAAEIETVASQLRTKSIQCNDPQVSTATGYLSEQVARLTAATNVAFSSKYGAGTQYGGRKVMTAIRPTVTETRFTLADALLQASCVDQADQIYRDTVSTFTGGMYESVRQRALIGIDDVRAKRTNP